MAVNINLYDWITVGAGWLGTPLYIARSADKSQMARCLKRFEWVVS